MNEPILHTVTSQTVERLRQLSRVMHEVSKKPRRAYNIRTLGTKAKSAEILAETLRIPLEEVPTCNTVACTAGWAGLDPWFRRRGFKVTLEPREACDPKTGDWGPVPGAFDLNFMQSIESAQDWEAFFGLTDEENRRLFYYGPRGSATSIEKREKITAKQVARYVDRLVKKYERHLTKQKKETATR